MLEHDTDSEEPRTIGERWDDEELALITKVINSFLLVIATIKMGCLSLRLSNKNSVVMEFITIEL
jgi:hypothetical protein